MLSRRGPARLSAGGLTEPGCQHPALQISSQRLRLDGTSTFSGGGCSSLQGPGRGDLISWQAANMRSDAGSGNRSLDLLPQLLAFLLLRLLLYSNQGLMSKITTANAAWHPQPCWRWIVSASSYHVRPSRGLSKDPLPSCCSLLLGQVQLVLGSSRASAFSLPFPAWKGQAGLTPKQPGKEILNLFALDKALL